MKAAIYVEDGVTQLILTPETNFEKEAVAKFENNELSAKIIIGSFYDCQGGFIRQSTTGSSIILRVNDEPEP